MSRTVKGQKLKEIHINEVIKLAERLGKDSAAQQALDMAKDNDYNCQFFASKDDISYSILVIPK